MQFSPKSNEKYTAAIRNYMQRKILECGISEKRKRALKKLWICGILGGNETEEPTDITGMLSSLCAALTAKFITKGFIVLVTVSGKHTGYIRAKTFEALVCMLALSCCRREKIGIIRAEISHDTVKITVNTHRILNSAEKLVKKLSGKIIRVKNEDRCGIILHFKECTMRIKDNYNPADYITDPFSTVSLTASCLTEGI